MDMPPGTFHDLDRRMGVTAVWQRGYQGAGITIGIADTGVIADDAELGGSVIRDAQPRR